MGKQAIEVIPGILEKDVSRIEERAKLVAPYVDWIQIDIADNLFVPNETLLDPQAYAAIMRLDAKYELHMMVENPLDVVDEWVGVGVKRLLFHVESKQIATSKSSIAKIVEKYRKQMLNQVQHDKTGVKGNRLDIGLVIDRDTPVEALFPYLNDVDCVLIMTIKAGFSGQSFIPAMLEKVKILRRMKKDLPIEVDGGINYDTARHAVAAGATRLVSTSTIFGADDIGAAIKRLKNSK